MGGGGVCVLLSLNKREGGGGALIRTIDCPVPAIDWLLLFELKITPYLSGWIHRSC